MKNVDFRIESIMDVQPSVFDSTFGNLYVFWDIDQHDPESDLISIYLKQFKIIESQSIDVRLKLIWSMNTVERVLWKNKFGVFTDGKNCYTNKNLYNFLKKTLNQ